MAIDAGPYYFFRGRCALAAYLKAIGLQAGDEVVVQSYTCLAVPEGVMASGAKPVYADIDPATLNLSRSSVIECLSPRSRAVIAQHTFGIPAPVDELAALCKERNLILVEDCCHSFHSSLAGKVVGSWGNACFHSYEWGKPLACGIGGDLELNEELAPQAVRQRLGEIAAQLTDPSLKTGLLIELQYLAFSILYRPQLYWPVRDLFRFLSKYGAAKGNYNPLGGDTPVADDFTLKIAKLVQKRIERRRQDLLRFKEHSEKIVQIYGSILDANRYKACKGPAYSQTIYLRYPLRVSQKENLLAVARKHNVELAAWYESPVHPLKETEYSKIHYKPGSCPEAERASREVVSLPCHERVSLTTAERLAIALNQL